MKIYSFFTKKNIFLATLTVFFISGIWAFQWPVDIDSPSSDIKTNFGEDRGNCFSNGFVFTSKDELKACADGKVLVYMNPDDTYYENFSSSLGNSVILTHPDNMLSVYSGFDDFNEKAMKEGFSKGESLEAVPESSTEEKPVKRGKEKAQTYEFQIIDTKNLVDINPFLLLPKYEDARTVYPGKITLVNKKNTEFNPETQKIINSGIYSIYRDETKGRMALKTVVAINGESLSVIKYDTLNLKNSKLCVPGNAFYDSDIVYPDGKKQFLGEIGLSRGKNILSVTVTDSLGVERKLSYALDVR